MSTKKVVTLANAVLTEYKTGPDASGKLRKCVICRGNFEQGEHWLKMTRPGEYSVGAHTACLVRNGHELDGAIAPERMAA